MMFKIAIASILSILPMSIQGCEDDVAPNARFIVEDRTVYPNEGVAAVWGSDGFISITVFCSGTVNGPISIFKEMPWTWYPGGNDSTHPAYYSQACSWWVPYIVGGYVATSAH